MRLTVTAASLLLIASLAPAQPFVEVGDVVVSYEEFCFCGFMFPKLGAWTADGRGKFSEYGGGGDVLAAPDGTLRVIPKHSPGKVITYSATLQQVGILDAGMHAAQSLAMDRDENLYVIAGDGEIRRFSKSGTPSGSYRIPLSLEGVLAADLDVDQCTMYYIANSPSGKRVRRYDLCRSRHLPDVPGSFSRFVDHVTIRVASDGGVLFAADGKIYRFANGETRAFTLEGRDYNNVAVVPEPGGRFVWSAGLTLARHDLLTGDTMARANSFSAAQPALAIYGVPRASAAPAPSAVPALSSSALLLLGITLAITGWFWIRR